MSFNSVEKITLDTNYVDFISEETFLSKGHLYVLPEYNTDISVAYQNENGTKTLYIFAVPIRYISEEGQLVTIDTRIKNIEDQALKEQGYLYTIARSDINTYYPKDVKKGILIDGKYTYNISIDAKKAAPAQYKEKINFINQPKKMISYKNVFGSETYFDLYPSSLGTNAEIILESEPKSNTLIMKLEANDCFINVEASGYITLNKLKTDESGNNIAEVVGLIQAPLLKDANGKFSYRNRLSIENNGDGKYNLKIILDNDFLNAPNTQYPIKCYTSFELRRDKQPDSSVYSNRSSLNSYLSNHTILGNSKDYGFGHIRIRYKFTKLLNLKSDNIIDATYSVYNLSEKNSKDTLELITLLEDWCSLTGTWANTVKTGKRITMLKTETAKLTFNIKEEVIKWCKDETGQLEHNGVLLKSINEKEECWNAISTNDCTLFNNYTEVIFK